MNEAWKTHPEPETLATFAQGRLHGTEAKAVVDHLDGCEECMSDVALAMEADGDSVEAGRFRRPAWLAGLAAAAALIALVSIPGTRAWLQRPFRTSPTSRLVALAPSDARLIEPRLTGGFAWAGYHGPARSSEDVTDAQRLKLGGVAGELVERADRDHDAETEHAAGVALLLVQKPVDGMARLEAAARSANDAKTWSDLAAARYATASSLGRASLYPSALAAADTALRLDPRLGEALFNRALILTRMGLSDDARRAWQHYLDVDPSSRWAAEARAHLTELPAATSTSRFERDRPVLEKAAADGDLRLVRALVDAHRESARAFGEADVLGQWGGAVQAGDAAAATRALLVARDIGDALVQLSGESLLRDAVHAIDTADLPSRATIAAAHAGYRTARIAYSRHQLETAERGLRDAAARFDSVHDPMALPARYFAAGARLARNDVAGARADLERSRAEADAGLSYISLAAHVRWELARSFVLDDDFPGALPILTEAAALFRRIGEHASEAVVEGMLADALTELGRPDDAWSARLLAFGALSAEGDAEYLAMNLTGAMRAELRSGRHDCALALSSIQRDAVERADVRPTLLVDTLKQRSMIESLSGNAADARRTSEEAEHAALRIPDPSLRDRELADIDVVRAAALGDADPRGASAALTRAIEFYRSRRLPFGLPEPLLLRARVALRSGDVSAASGDLEEGIAVLEQHPAQLGGAGIGTGMLDAEHALFTAAIRLRLDRGENAAAFALAERARGSALSVIDLQRRLAGSGAAVLELVALPDELVTFAIAEGDFLTVRRPHGTATYDDVIRPAETVVSRARLLIVVPDARFDGVSFAALRDGSGNRYLVERLPVAIASSAASLTGGGDARGALRSITAVGLPSGTETAALPDAERELADVAALYTRATTIPPARATFAALGEAAAADVLHIAGHTERQQGGGEQALVFADRRVSWKTILAAPPLHARVVVLAACETFRVPAARTRALSLAGAFSAAGAEEVIGTLAPIPDRDALALFRSIQRSLAGGATAAEAVRSAQLESIALERAGESARAWQDVAVLTRRIDAPPHR
jgi:tetratricopeptide (TPR) repeat protein